MPHTLSLHTFGGLSLRLGGQNITGAATQRRRMALFAVLAVAGDLGMPREKLIALIWPEASAERARHILGQLLYAQRQELEAKELFLGGKNLRLNPELIGTDVGQFQLAMGAGDPAGAVAVYRGAFLDGFHLGGNDDFERWQAGERERLARLHAQALESLARQAAVAGDQPGAAEWWRRLALHEPLNTRIAGALVASLATAGDRAGALRCAAEHDAALRDEIGVSPDAWFLELVERLRTTA